MTHCATILIADRNPYVRQFLQREMHRAGYAVLLAESGRQVLFWIERFTGLDVVVLDPDFPDIDPDTLVTHLRRQCPTLPIVIHAHPGEETIHSENMAALALQSIAKGANSSDEILRVVAGILQHRHRTDGPFLTPLGVKESGNPEMTAHRSRCHQKTRPDKP